MKKLYKILTAVETYFLFILFLFTSFSIVVNVMGRKLFGFSFNWLEEFSRYVLIIVTFIGISIATTRNIHPKMDAVQNLFKEKAHLAIQIIAKLIFAVFMCIMFYYSFRQLRNMMRIPASTATLKIPLYAIYMFLFAGLLGTSIRSIVSLGMTVRDFVLYRRRSAEEQGDALKPAGEREDGGSGSEGGDKK